MKAQAGRFFLIFFLALGLVGCQRAVITRPQPAIAFEGDRLTYRGARFTGTVETRLPGVEMLRRTPYRDGLIDGAEEDFYADGRRGARRTYARGRKVGTHEAWYPDGRRRTLAEYRDDAYDGEVWEWHPSGALSAYARFEAGRCVGKKLWRADGTIYMNYVFPEGRPVGLPGAKLCFQVRK